MAMTRAEMLQKSAEATASSVGNYLRDGRGRLAVKKLEFSSGYKGDRFVASFVVVSSQKIPVYSEKQQKALDIEPNPAGTDVDLVWMLKHPSTWGNIKALVFALFGESEETTPQAEFKECLDEISGPGQTAKGMQVDYSTIRKVSDENKVELILPKWSTVEQTDEVIAQTKKWMDSLVANKSAVAAPPLAS